MKSEAEIRVQAFEEAAQLAGEYFFKWTSGNPRDIKERQEAGRCIAIHIRSLAAQPPASVDAEKFKELIVEVQHRVPGGSVKGHNFLNGDIIFDARCIRCKLAALLPDEGKRK